MKIIAVASAGGHWIQLLRMRPAFENAELIFISTKQSFDKMVKDHRFYAVPDGNRKDKLKIFEALYKLYKIVKTEKPDVIVSTGAAPGLLAIIVGKFLGAKTIWIDSLANVKQISLSGRIALTFADRFYTQWPDLAKGKIMYAGNVMI